MRFPKMVAALAVLIPALTGTALAANCPGSPFNLTNGTNADASQVMANFNNILNCINQQPGLVFAPMGRLTLQSGKPSLTSAVSGATTVYYTPYQGNLVPLWSGSGFVATTFSELSNVLANAGSAGPTAAVADTMYDLFVWSNGGTVTLTRGPAWSSGTSRNLTLTRVSGVLTNTAAITNGPAAGYGTYVGTILTDTTGGTVSFIPAVAAAGGGISNFGVWNAFNRLQVVGTVSNTNATWTMLSATPREAQGGPLRVRFMAGQPEDAVTAVYTVAATTPNANWAAGYVGIGVDNTASFDQSSVFMNGPTAGVVWYKPLATSLLSALEGRHFIAAMEASDGANWQTFYGSVSNGSVNNRLSVTLRY